METPEQPTPLFYGYQSGKSLRPAAALLIVALGLTVLLPAADLRLLAFLFVLPPLIWGSRELLRQRTGLTLEAEALVLRHPLSIRPLRIPYDQIGGVIAWPRDTTLGIAYYVPRPPFEGGDDPRPPRLRLTSTAPLVDGLAALVDLCQRVDQVRQSQGPESSFPPLAAEVVRQRLRMRRFRRAALAVAAFLATPLFTILAARIAFVVINAVRFLWPN